MRLQFDKGGRRFFFLTFCVRGRSAVLSRIVEKVGRDGKLAYGVELTAAGEAMAALWRGIHARWPFLTASNYIIMPDHLHLLLIVDYSKAQGFDILDWFQRFRREGEDVVSPIIGVKPELVWEDHFWILLLNAGKPLAAVRRYIKMNPARKIWKDGHPDLFVRRGGLRHHVLDASLSWTAIGDLTLLANPFMFPVGLTRKKTVAQHEQGIAQMVERARRGEVPVCGFLSPGEKELERRLRQEPHARWIKTVAHGLPPRFDPTVEDSRFLAEGRQLLLSSFPVDVPVFPVNYDNCHLMNARNEELCKRATAQESGVRGEVIVGTSHNECGGVRGEVAASTGHNACGGVWGEVIVGTRHDASGRVQGGVAIGPGHNASGRVRGATPVDVQTEEEL